MPRTWTVVGALLLTSLSACKKNEPAQPPIAPPVAPRPPVPPPPPAPAAAPSADEMKALLTDDKLARFATYQREMLPGVGDAVGAGFAAYQKAGADVKKLQGEMAGDGRTAKVAATAEAALAKSGLGQDEVNKLSRVVTAYYARTYAMQDAVKKAAEVRAKLEAAKATGKTPSPVDIALDKVYSDQLGRLEAARQEFGEHYGEDALAAVKKHEPEFHAINEKMMGAALGGLAGKK
jgi:hypothetical protein